ncbi:hypothetical protein [Acinetobacter nectaris]|uniref:hypothetical protein n=1 Tax=Acinetobacter nectaris TaxID=1219382 RepID=UPI001F15BA5A|nr:hypothetical protein [Acinetobacter nectaris]MCF9034307.1 hypothetical protein [Acinetobacter nectaris]
MNLLEKAKLIQEIRQNLSKVEQPSALIEKAKAMYRLKEIIQCCNRPHILIKEPLTQLTQEKETILTMLQKFEYKQSYCGAFDSKQNLLYKFNKCDPPRWAILYQPNQTFWQIWITLGPHRSTIHSDWYRQLKDAYTWLIEQQKFFIHLQKDLG